MQTIPQTTLTVLAFGEGIGVELAVILAFAVVGLVLAALVVTAWSVGCWLTGRQQAGLWSMLGALAAGAIGSLVYMVVHGEQLDGLWFWPALLGAAICSSATLVACELVRWDMQASHRRQLSLRTLLLLTAIVAMIVATLCVSL